MHLDVDEAFDLITARTPILIHTPRAESFGICAEDMFFGLLKAQRENGKILFLRPQNLFFKKFVANRKLFDVQSPYTIQNKVVRLLGGWFLTLEIALMWLRSRSPLKGLRRMFRLIWPRKPASSAFDFHHMAPTIGRARLWNPDGISYFSWEIVKEQNWEQQYDEYVPPELLENDHRHAEELRVRMGIPLTDWFVCLHAREGGYYQDQSINRNVSIHNYIEGIEVVTAAGGWVVRMGDASMTPLPPLERVIDYPHTKYKSELMDIYLISRCRLFIGTNSGPNEVANLFAKPMVFVNVTEWSVAYPMKRGDLAIIKHVFSHSRNRFLSIRELLEESTDWQDFGPGLNGYSLVENTPEEIRDVITEYLARPADHEYSELQETFNDGRRKQIHRWFDREGTSPHGLIGTYRIAARCDSAAGTLGQMYLEQNWLRDSSAQNMSNRLTVS